MPAARPAAWLVSAVISVGAGATAASAQAQVYANAPASDGQDTLVLSNFASEQTPVLLIERPAVQEAPVGKASVTLPASTPATPEPLAALPTASPSPTALKRAPTPPAAWLPLFTRVAREHAVPAGLLLAVAAAESGFDPRARSPKGALGLMQLMPGTARDRGVRAVWSVSDNLRGGAAHLRLLLTRFAGRPDLAVAAYNAGEQAVINAGVAVPDFDETRRYVPKVLAWHAEYEALLGRDRSAPATRRSAQALPALRLAGTP
jgi:soluble lytic murein transglycosylase-like protein